MNVDVDNEVCRSGVEKSQNILTFAALHAQMSCSICEDERQLVLDSFPGRWPSVFLFLPLV